MTKKEICSALSKCDSFTTFQRFLEYAPELDDEVYWWGLGFAHDCSDNLFNWKQEVRQAFTSTRLGREALMTAEERMFLDALPQKITIYRGMTLEEQKSQDFGVCWTFNPKIAKFFAYEYPRNFSTNHLEKTVHEMEIDKSDVVAFLNDRKESTIIYVHERQQDSMVSKRKPSKNKVLKKIKSKIKENLSTHTYFAGDQLDIEEYKEACRDVISVKEIDVQIKEYGNIDVTVDLDFYVSLRNPYFVVESDREGEFYKFLAETQKNFQPPRINKALKKILGLPSDYRKLKKNVLISKTRFSECKMNDLNVFVRFEKRIAISDYKF